MQHIQLQTSLKFTTDDLKANREGRISEKQGKKYEAPKIPMLVIAVVLGHAVLVGGILGAIAIITGNTAMWFVLGLVLALGLLPFVLMQNEGNIRPALRGDIKQGTVKKACGIAILTQKKNRHNITQYKLYVDGINIILTSTQASGFVNEALYCIYYLPRSMTLLSAEPMSE